MRTQHTFTTTIFAIALAIGVCGCSVLQLGNVSIATADDDAPVGSALVVPKLADPLKAASSVVKAVLPQIAGGVELDRAAIPGFDVAQSAGSVDSLEAPVAMTPFVCGCLAASHSKVADALEQEAASKRQENAKHHGNKGESSLTPQILDDQALEKRNDAAEDALEAYFLLAEVQLQQVVLDDNVQELERTSDVVHGLLAADIDVVLDQTELDRQSAQLALKQAQLRFTQLRLTARIKSLIGADPMSSWQIRTNCSIDPRPAQFELNEAIAIARQNDSQLNALRKLRDSHRPEDMELAAKLMGVVSPLAGMDSSSSCLLTLLGAVCGGHGAAKRKESQLRRGQMSKLHDARQQQLDLEVAAALIHVREQLVAVGIAKDTYDSWSQRVAVLESQREVQRAEYLEVVNAKSARLVAQSALNHELVLLEIAHVKLHAAIGLLGRECASMNVQSTGHNCPPDMSNVPSMESPEHVTTLTRKYIRR